MQRVHGSFMLTAKRSLTSKSRKNGLERVTSKKRPSCASGSGKASTAKDSQTGKWFESRLRLVDLQPGN